jgi:CTD kinase subunit alpha
VSTAINSAGKASKNGTSNRKGDDSTNGKSQWLKRGRKARESRLDPDSNQDYQDEGTRDLSTSFSAPHHIPSSEQSAHSLSILMPPPPIPQTQFIGVQSSPEGFRVAKSAPVGVDIAASKQNRSTSAKSAGFKPIGKASSAVKKFFPKDEEDMDVTLDRQHRASGAVASAEPSSSQRAWANGAEPILDVVVPSLAVATEPMPQESRSLPLHSEQATLPPAGSIKHATMPRKQSSLRGTDAHERPLSPLEEVMNAVSIDQRLSPRDTQDPSNDGISLTSSKDLYKIINQVGEGTFGKVYKARNMVTGGHVALKRIRMESERDGFPVTAMREIKLLQSLRHENIVRLYEMMVSNGTDKFAILNNC